eukprot:5768189-Alexandrium_andersonii.AAC.1
MLQEKATWTRLRSAVLPCGPKRGKSTYGSAPERINWHTADNCFCVGSISSKGLSQHLLAYSENV